MALNPEVEIQLQNIIADLQADPLPAASVASEALRAMLGGVDVVVDVLDLGPMPAILGAIRPDDAGARVSPGLDITELLSDFDVGDSERMDLMAMLDSLFGLTDQDLTTLPPVDRSLHDDWGHGADPVSSSAGPGGDIIAVLFGDGPADGSPGG